MGLVILWCRRLDNGDSRNRSGLQALIGVHGRHDAQGRRDEEPDEERALEDLYRRSHSDADLRQIRREWKAAYRSIRAVIAAEEARLNGLTHLHSALRRTCPAPQRCEWSVAAT